MNYLPIIKKRLYRVKSRVHKRLASGAFPTATPVVGRDLENYFFQVASNYQSASNSFWYYRYLIDELRGLTKLQLVPLQDLMVRPAEDRCLVGLRHDVDADPLTALRCARYLARQGIGGSFYLLHTAVYYGEFYGDLFIRMPRLPEWIKSLIVAGCEVGLHNDSLGVYECHGQDGIVALCQELAWLRQHGLRITGTVAHNSGPIYGAENFEIFSGHRLWSRKVTTSYGRRLPLGVLDMRGLGLTYEGTFARPKPKIDQEMAEAFFADRASGDAQSELWMKRYLLENPCCDWGVDVQFWLVGKDRWVIAGRYGTTPVFEWNASLAQVLDRIKALPDGSRSVLIIHPELVRGGG